jgi:hypothetical protein
VDLWTRKRGLDRIEKKRNRKRRRREDVMEKRGLSACAPGSTRELELVRVRAMECIRDWGSAAPDCVRVRKSGATTGTVPLAEAEEVR